MLRKNGYNDRKINKSSSKEYVKQSAKVNVPPSDTTERIFFVKLPYSKASHSTNDIVNEMNQKISHHSIKINAVYSTFKTKFLFRNKDKIDLFVWSPIVYKYICDTCNKIFALQNEQILKSLIIFNT